MTYSPPDVSTLADAHKGLAYSTYQALQPGFRAPQASPTTSRLEAYGQLSAEVATALHMNAEQLTLTEAALRGINRNAAVSATASSTWTATDGIEHTIDALSTVTITDSTGRTSQWVVPEAVTFTTATLAGEVTLVALTPGATLTGTTGSVVAVQPKYAWTDTITLTGPATGGRDEEPYADFLSRVGDEFVIGSRLIVKAEDLQILTAGLPDVGYALARRTYKPGGPNPSALDMTVAVADTEQQPMPTLHAEIEAFRTADCCTLHAVDFDDHPLTIELDVVKYDDWDTAVVEDQVRDAVYAWSQAWGLRQIGTVQQMEVEDTARLDAVAAVANTQMGVKYPVFSSVKIGIDGGAATHSDKTLTGDFPLGFIADPATDIVVNVS